MLQVKPNTLVLAVGGQGIDLGVTAANGWQADSVRHLPFAAMDGVALSHAALLAQALESLEPGAVPAAIHVVLPDSWLGSAVMPWNSVVAVPAHAAQLARQHLVQAGIEVGAADTVVLDDAPFGAPRMVLCYPAEVMEALRQFAARTGAPLRSVQARSLAAWSQLPRKRGTGPAALAVLEGAAMTLAHGARNILEVTTRSAGPAGAGQELSALWRRLCLRDPQLATLEQVCLFDLGGTIAPGSPFEAAALPGMDGVPPALVLAARSKHAGSLDGVAARPGDTRPAWLVAMVCVALAGAWGQQAWQVRQAAQQLESKQQLAARAAQRSAPAPVAWNRDELARIPAVNAAIRQLNQPVGPVLRALVPPQELQVAVLGVDVGGGQAAGAGRLRIQAEARTGADMARYAAFVAQGQHFKDAYLSEHQVAPEAPGQPYRFTVEAVWRE
ncbi:hypothetical protein ACN9MZ_28975 [Pseudoduganella sp. S-14]|uniref:hypothetical protein n=1 Tax=Pseudoduganella sp. S-14 TaxID=3404065 RepID=UPI003CEA3437